MLPLRLTPVLAQPVGRYRDFLVRRLREPGNHQCDPTELTHDHGVGHRQHRRRVYDHGVVVSRPSRVPHPDSVSRGARTGSGAYLPWSVHQDYPRLVCPGRPPVGLAYAPVPRSGPASRCQRSCGADPYGGRYRSGARAARPVRSLPRGWRPRMTCRPLGWVR